MAIQRSPNRQPANFRTPAREDFRSKTITRTYTGLISALADPSFGPPAKIAKPPFDEPERTCGVSSSSSACDNDEAEIRDLLTRRNTIQELAAQIQAADPQMLYADVLAATTPQAVGRSMAVDSIGGDD